MNKSPVHWHVPVAVMSQNLEDLLRLGFSDHRPVAGGGAGGLEPPQKFSDELNSATKVEFFY